MGWVGLPIAALFAYGCDEGSPASPANLPVTMPTGTAWIPDAGTDATASRDADAGPRYFVCPDGGMDATYGSVYSALLSGPGCGASRDGCHTTFSAMRTGSQLDLSLDASAVYEELLGPDGGGQLATNVDSDAGVVLLRVVPGDAGASMLYIKLTLMGFDSRYGWGMPYDQPGSICPPAVAAVKAWIDDGAAR